ncbi:uncharacterized protein LOC129947125 [Eupeodes corollae]|uniref:uncharacterized protein LOC129947125 n=1 Tax=Eupeodes corollae TaxID=290404 RepID=UPI00248FAC63|nr:uncharacterized protein LOC129947125 [Eupeodes corollae]
MQNIKQKRPQSTKTKRQFPNRAILACKTVNNANPHLSQDEIYKFFENSLKNEGYLIAVKYFQELVVLEENLIRTDIRLKKRVRDYYCLLLAIVQNIKLAEDAYRTDPKDEKLTLRLLIQTVHMIQAQDLAFNWLVKEIFKIILKLSNSWGDECLEDLSRVYFEYGIVLAEKDECLEEAISFMEKSLDKCKGTTWYTNDMDRKFLVEDVCAKLCDTLLRLAALNFKKNVSNSASLAERASEVIYGVGIKESANLYCCAKLRQSEYLAAKQRYQEALDILKNIEKHIMANDSKRNKCEFYLNLGISHFNVSSSDANLALRKLKLSLNLSNENNFADLKAKTLLNLGKIHSKNHSTHVEARECFIEAKDLFGRQRDFENEKLAIFLMAQLRAHQIFPTYLELIKKASKNSFCHMYDLFQWQQKLIPFWNEEGELRHYEDDIECILKENLDLEVQQIVKSVD